MIEIEDNFSLIDDENLINIYNQTEVPIFQNKVFPTKEDAKSSKSLPVNLYQNKISGFIFNKTFDSSKMNYDAHYQNEQAHSNYFNEHLNYVLDLLKSFNITDKKIVEIGCGKGYFFEKMEKANFNCIGFDPTYEGVHPKIIKEYFTEDSNITCDVIILRHTLEHIEQPFSFIHQIAKANKYRGHIFVEVPTFEWIINKKAFWDIFYEHCNYFTESSLSAMFKDSITGSFFNGQYIYLWADLALIKNKIDQQPITKFENTFKSTLTYWQNFLSKNKNIAVWGAGAKGSTFLNLLDKSATFVKCVIDINSVKQNKFLGGTAHRIISPTDIIHENIDHIIVMNENYINEIKLQIQTLNINCNIISI